MLWFEFYKQALRVMIVLLFFKYEINMSKGNLAAVLFDTRDGVRRCRQCCYSCSSLQSPVMTDMLESLPEAIFACAQRLTSLNCKGNEEKHPVVPNKGKSSQQ